MIEREQFQREYKMKVSKLIRYEDGRSEAGNAQRRGRTVGSRCWYGFEMRNSFRFGGKSIVMYILFFLNQ